MSNDILVKIGADVAGFSRDMKKVTDDLQNIGKNTEKSNLTVGKLAKSLGLVAAGAKAFQVLSNSVGDAVSRFDTLNQFPKVLEALGVSAEDAEKSVDTLSDGIDGLPTKLDDIASTAQRMYTSFGDMDKATESALALNNALLGSGASSEQASRGTEMYLKMLQTGHVDLQTWRSLSETMDVGLVKIAESFGYAGKSAKDDLYKALQDGSITIEEFNDKLIEVGTGTGVMADLARENSLGLATSLTNLGTAVSRNLANIIESFDNLSKEVTGKSIAEHIDGLKVIINNAFDIVRKAIELTTPLFKVLATAVKFLYEAIKPLTPVIIGATTALLGLLAVQKLQAMFTGASAGARILTTATSLLTGKLTLATVATKAFAVAKKLLGGPVGLAVAGIGALVGGVVSLVKWFRRDSDEAKKLNAEMEKLASETESLTDATESSAKAYESKQSSTEAEIRNNEELARKVQELADKENKSAAEKEMLKSYTDELNESMDGLNLTYDEESGKLNQSSEMIQARIDLMGEQEKANDAMERAKEITEEQVKVEKKLEETNKLREEWNNKLDDGSVKAGEHKKAIEELDSQEKELNDTLGNLQEQHKTTEAQVEESMNAIAKATEASTESQILDYESLDDAQKKIIDEMSDRWKDLQDVATEAFSKISEESSVSAEEMIENLKHNQEVVEDWGKNVAELHEKAGKEGNEGFLQWLDQLGPDSAAELAVVNEMTDEQLKEFMGLMSNGADLATDGFSESLGKGGDEIIDQAGHLIIDIDGTMRDKISSIGFDRHGEEIAGGTAKGIKDRAIVAATSVSDMVSDMRDVFTKENEIKSPSRLYKRLAENIPLGTKQGIDGKSSGAVSAVKNMANKMTSSMQGIKSTFSKIGSESIAGLSRGLDANKGSLFSKASSIASNIAGRMRSALKIASPSRVMADIGRWIPEGLADGIDGNSNKVYNAVQSMTSGIQAQDLSLDYATPGGVKSSLAGAVSGTVDVNSGDGELSASINELRRDLTNLRIVMDGDKVGELIGPRINEKNAVDSEIGRYFD